MPASAFSLSSYASSQSSAMSQSFTSSTLGSTSDALSTSCKRGGTLCGTGTTRSRGIHLGVSSAGLSSRASWAQLQPLNGVWTRYSCQWISAISASSWRPSLQASAPFLPTSSPKRRRTDQRLASLPHYSSPSCHRTSQEVWLDPTITRVSPSGPS